MLDLLYVAHNRLEFTRASFAALLANTDWSLVRRLVVHDDDSTDGTRELLYEMLAGVDRDGLHAMFQFPYPDAAERGPVAAMNRYLGLVTHDGGPASVFAKVDNDLIVCPGWLNQMHAVLDANPGLDVLGLEPGFGQRFDPARPADRSAVRARHVGGIGLIRTRVFARGTLRPNDRFFGWTQFQEQHAECGWITPDLPCFLLDHLPVEPWRSLAADYVEQGWARAWPSYADSMRAYWSWWTRDHEVVA